MEINLQDDLNSVTEQVNKLVDELNKMANAREGLVQQIQNLNGVAMYIRGKLPPEDQVSNTVPTEIKEETKKTMSKKKKAQDFERTAEYPPDK